MDLTALALARLHDLGHAIDDVGSFSAPELLRHPFSRALWHALPGHDFATFGTVGDDLEVTR